MPAALPVVEDTPGASPSLWSGGAVAETTLGNAGVSLGGTVGGNVGSGSPENTHLWMAGVMLIALALLIYAHIIGFRFNTDVGVVG